MPENFYPCGHSEKIDPVRALLSQKCQELHVDADENIRFFAGTDFSKMI